MEKEKVDVKKSITPIRVLHVVPDMAYGGVEKVILNYYSQLDHAKYIFDFVTHGKIEDYHSKLISDGSRLFYFKTIGELGYHGYKKQIADSICLKEYDIVHIHVGHLTGVYAKVFRSLGAPRIISHAHTTKCVNTKHRFFMPLFRLLSVHYSDELVACGSDAGKFCFGKAEYKLLHNVVDFQRYENVTENDISELRDKLGIDLNTFVVGHVGHFSKPKNHSFIAELIIEYSKICSNVKFILVGDGPLKKHIEQLIPENIKRNFVVFTGVRNDVPVLMKLFDVFILPSLHEGLPVVGLEAQAAGTPCVFSNTIDRTVCICKENCEFVPINEGTKVWVAAISRMRNRNKNSDENIYEAFCKSGYEISASVCKLKEIYNRLIQEN